MDGVLKITDVSPAYPQHAVQAIDRDPGSLRSEAAHLLRRSNIVCGGPGTAGWGVISREIRAAGGTVSQGALRTALASAAGEASAAQLASVFGANGTNAAAESVPGRVVDPSAIS